MNAYAPIRSTQIRTRQSPKIDLAVSSQLPTLPQLAVAILETFNNIDTPIEKIIQIIERDPAVTSKIMKTVNSALYSPNSPIADLRRAVLMLGKRAITPLVLSFCLAPETFKNDKLSEQYMSYWLTAITRSISARVIANKISPEMSGEASTVALLSNIGRLAFLKHHPDLTLECLGMTEGSQMTENEIEKQVFGFSHLDLSVEILTHLRFARRGTLAIRLQNEDANSIKRQTTADDINLILAIAASRAISEYIFCGSSPVSYLQISEYLQELKHPGFLKPESVVDEVFIELKDMEALFEMDLLRIPTPITLLQRSLEQLADFSLMLQEDHIESIIPHQLLEENGTLKQRVADLLVQATVDPLTMVYNRRHTDALMNEMLTLAELNSYSIGILFIDVDHFKHINDQFGHMAGDRILKHVAETLSASVRDCDIVGRYGGDEFQILLNNPSMEGFRNIAQRISQTVEQMKLQHEGQQIPITVSIGGCITTSVNSSAFAKDIFKFADLSLYQAKRSGRNRVVIEQIPAG